MADFIVTNDQYRSGFEVNEYNGRFSLIAARENNGTVYQKWGEQEIGKDKTKRLPVAVEIGSSKSEAIANLMLAIDYLNGQDSRKPVPDDDIPF